MRDEKENQKTSTGIAEYTTQGRPNNYYTIDMLESKKYEKVRIRLVEEQSKVTEIKVYYVKGEYGARNTGEVIKGSQEEFQSNVGKTENTSIWISVAVCKKQEFQEQREDFDSL